MSRLILRPSRGKKPPVYLPKSPNYLAAKRGAGSGIDLGACLTNDRRREGATHASHGRPWMVAPGLRGAGTAQRNASHRADFCDRYATHSGYYVSETIAEICR